MISQWKDLLSRGQTIELGIAEGKIERTFPSIIEDLSDDALLVAVPITRQGRVTLSKHQKATVYFNQYKSRYFFTTRVLDRACPDHLTVYLNPPERIRRFERRRDARVDVWMISMEASIPSGDKKDSWAKIPGTIKNISGSGLLLETTLPIGEGTPIMLKIKLSKDWDHITTKGYPVNSRMARGLRGYRHFLGVHFTEIDEKDRDRIQWFVFRQQLMLRRKGLL